MNNSLWTHKQKTVAVLVPTRDTVHSHFSFCLTQLVKTNQEAGIETLIFFDASTILLNQRINLANKAVEANAEYILWLDSDMMFPPTTLLRLLKHNKDIVACNYMKRAEPVKSVAYKNIKDWNSWLPLIEQDELETVEGVGMGCMLMKTKLFNELEPPYFYFKYDTKLGIWHGEDFELCKNLRKLGYSIFIDMSLSTQIKHVGLFSFGEKYPTNKQKIKTL